MLKSCVLSFLIWIGANTLAMAGGWSTGAPLQTGRAALGAGVLNNRIYAIGGAGILKPLSNAETYQTGMGGWRVNSDLPVGLESFGMAVLDGKLYAAGGYASDTDGYPTARMWEYDPQSDEWTQGPSMPSPRAGFALIANAGALYAFGGTGPESEKLFIFNPNDREWRTLEQGLTNSRDLAAIAIGDRIYVIAGGPAATPVAAVHIFNTRDESWSEGPALPIARSGHAIALFAGEIHVLGGRSSGRGMSLADHWVLDVDLAQWHEAEPLPSPRTGAAAVTLDGAIYLIGGGAGGGFFAPFTAMTETDVWRPGPNGPAP